MIVYIYLNVIFWYLQYCQYCQLLFISRPLKGAIKVNESNESSTPVCFSGHDSFALSFSDKSLYISTLLFVTKMLCHLLTYKIWCKLKTFPRSKGLLKSIVKSASTLYGFNVQFHSHKMPSRSSHCNKTDKNIFHIHNMWSKSQRAWTIDICNAINLQKEV